MKDMLDRNVAWKLIEWKDPVFYISYLAVLNPKSKSPPVGIVLNSSQVSQGVSLKSCLAKGPDWHMTNLIGILLYWRERRVAIASGIRKMSKSVLLQPLQ